MGPCDGQATAGDSAEDIKSCVISTRDTSFSIRHTQQLETHHKHHISLSLANDHSSAVYDNEVRPHRSICQVQQYSTGISQAQADLTVACSSPALQPLAARTRPIARGLSAWPVPNRLAHRATVRCSTTSRTRARMGSGAVSLADGRGKQFKFDGVGESYERIMEGRGKFIMYGAVTLYYKPRTTHGRSFNSNQYQLSISFSCS